MRKLKVVESKKIAESIEPTDSREPKITEFNAIEYARQFRKCSAAQKIVFMRDVLLPREEFQYKDNGGMLARAKSVADIVCSISEPVDPWN